MKLFLTSSLANPVSTVEGDVYSKINNKNQLLRNLQNALQATQRFVYIASSPSDYDANDLYSAATLETFRKSGLAFETLTLLDNRYKGDIAEAVLHSDLIFLAGGQVDEQMAYFERLGLQEILSKYSGVVVGMSAGSMNCSELVVCAPEEERQIGRIMKWKGLGLTSLILEPHFLPSVSTPLDLKLREALLKLSKTYAFCALCDDSYVYIDDDTTTVYGEAYTVFEGEVTLICKHGGSRVV